MRLVRLFLLELLCAVLTMHSQSSIAQQGAQPIPPPPGQYFPVSAGDLSSVPSFGENDRIVMTQYFYWYDAPSKAHLLDGDGSDALTTHPASLEDFSYKSVTWHKQQLRDMSAAGIEVALPVYWGAPSEQGRRAPMHWSFEGLPPLAQAIDELARAGEKTPRVGLFYDTSTLRYNSWNYHADLTTEYGRQWFYASIRDFFSMIPPRHWALIDGRPVVMLYSAAFALKHDQGVIDYVYGQFARDFGGRKPYIIREVSWAVKADNVYAWGGAVRPNFLGIAEIGPGYDHSSVPGREPLVVPREDGAFYERGWQKAIRRGSRIICLETWNEFHEGTDISESREYGRKYIEMSRKYVDRLRSGWQPPPVSGPYSNAEAVSVTLGPEDRMEGLKRIEVEDGRTSAALPGGEPCRVSRASQRQGRYVYFQIDESFKSESAMELEARVEYLDSPSGELSLEYDSFDERGTLLGAYTHCGISVKLGGSQKWKTAIFPMTNARLVGSQNGDSDFRLVLDGPEVFLGKVAVRKVTAGGSSAK